MIHAVFIDSEPMHPIGGGIRTYIKTVTSILENSGIPYTIYSHNPEAYPGSIAQPIGRIPWPKGILRPLRHFAYRFQYDTVLAMEHALFLANALAQHFQPDQRFEFCDYNGYAYYCFQNQSIRQRSAIRLHTPWMMIKQLSKTILSIDHSFLMHREMSALQTSPRVFFPSKEFASQYFPTLKGEVLYNPPTRKPLHLTAAAQFPNAPHFLFAGRWEPRKGLLQLVKAFHSFVQTHPVATLTIVGNPPKNEYANTLIESDEFKAGVRNHWIDIKPEVAGDKSELFNNISFLLVPSLWENAPYLFQEAMAYGVIALGSSTGEMQAIQSQTHQVFPTPGNINSWASCLSEIWERRQEMAHWRELQWKWLEQRTIEASKSIVKTWTDWPISS